MAHNTKQRTEANSMVLQLSNQDVMLYGKPKRLEVAPQLKGDFTMVPLTLIAVSP
jgi:hypothetical protein